MGPRRYETCNDRGVHDLAYCPEGHSIESFEHVHVTELVPSPRVEIQRVPVVNDKGDKDYVLVMDVACSENQVVRQRKDGKVALRQGDTSMWLDYTQIRTLEYDRGECYFESEVLADTSLDDIDPGAVDVYRRAVGTHVSDEKLLHSLGVLKEGHLTKAGMMLFGENVGAHLPQARFRVLKIDGTELGYGNKLRIIKDKTFEGPFVKTIPEARAFISSQLRDYQFQEQETMRFTTMHEYPEYPWFEGLVNAVTHRDYSIYGEYIRVYIYDDRMLIQSPGKLPGAVTLDNIRNHRFSRNPTIARVFSAFDWVRELNEGVDKIFQEMDEAGLPAPEYENDGDYYLKLVLKNNLMQRVPRLRHERTVNVGNVGNHDGNPAANVGNHVGNTKIQLNDTEEKVLELVIEDHQSDKSTLDRTNQSDESSNRTNESDESNIKIGQIDMQKGDDRTNQVSKCDVSDKSALDRMNESDESILDRTNQSDESEDLQCIERERAIVNFLMRNGSSTRAEIAEAIGLKPSRTSEILSAAIEKGLIVAEGKTKNRRFKIAEI